MSFSDAIPANLSWSEWQNTTSGAVAVYGEDAGPCNSTIFLLLVVDARCDPSLAPERISGRSCYNWYAVDDARISFGCMQ